MLILPGTWTLPDRTSINAPLDYRDNSINDSTRWTWAASLRIDYRWRRRYRFEPEDNGERSMQELTTTSENTSSYFVSVGYWADF